MYQVYHKYKAQKLISYRSFTDFVLWQILIRVFKPLLPHERTMKSIHSRFISGLTTLVQCVLYILHEYILKFDPDFKDFSEKEIVSYMSEEQQTS